jgi:periplasmic protein TonB
MKNLTILTLLLLLNSTSNAQRWSSAFIGKPESRALYASNVAKAIQNAWESEISSKEKKEMLLDEIIFGQESEKKIDPEMKDNNTSLNNIDEIEEVLGIKEKAIDPIKKKKIEVVQATKTTGTPLPSPTKNTEEITNNPVIDEKANSINKERNSILNIKIDDTEVDSIYALPQVSAMFPGGLVAMQAFFFSNIKTPESTGKSVKGKVFVRFMVKRNGEIVRIYLVKGLNDACNQEAMRVIKKMPKWIPATQEGEDVSSWHTLPIYFEIE